MKTTLRPANSKARALFKKLQALAEREWAGEMSAQNKIARLKARFDFTVADPAETPICFRAASNVPPGKRIYCVLRQQCVKGETRSVTVRGRSSTEATYATNKFSTTTSVSCVTNWTAGPAQSGLCGS